MHALTRTKAGLRTVAGLLWMLQACGDGQTAETTNDTKEANKTDLPEAGLPEAGLPEAGTPAFPLILGHKGAGSTHPGRHFAENTVVSAVHAISQGAEGLELDVWMTADDVVVLAHDDALASHPSGAGTRRTDCDGSISRALWSELGDCRVLPAHPEGEAEPLSTLDELLDAADNAQLLVLDLKVDDSGDRGEEARRTVDAIAEVLEHRDIPPRVLLGLYQTRTRHYAEGLGVDSCLKYHGHLGWDDAELLSHLDEVDDWGLCVNYCIFSEGLADALKRRSRGVLVYANDPEGTQVGPATLDRILHNLRLGRVDAFLTDDVPGALVSRQQRAAPGTAVRAPRQECGDTLRIRGP